MLETLYRDTAGKDEHRAAALMGLSDIAANLLNPNRDYARALVWAETLVAEFPDSELNDEARDRVEELRRRQ